MCKLCQRSAFAALFILTTLLNGCVLISPHVEPFSFESVSVGDPTETRRSTPLTPYELETSQGEFLEVRIQSKTNLAAVVEDRHLNLWIEPWFCDGDVSLRLVRYGSYGSVRYKDTSINYFAPKNEREYVQSLLEKVPKNAPKTYFFYLKVMANLYDIDHRPHTAYNLREISSDICVVVRSGGMGTGGFTSNTIVVPKEKIRDAFKAK